MKKKTIFIGLAVVLLIVLLFPKMVKHDNKSIKNYKSLLYNWLSRRRVEGNYHSGYHELKIHPFDDSDKS